VRQLKSRESDIAAQIRNKERTRQKLAQNLQTIIRRETELARKEAIARQKAEEERQKQADQQSTAGQKSPAADHATAAERNNLPPAATTTVTQPKVTRTYSPLEATAEGLTQSLNFENNKGRLPWPVSSGYVSVPFGKYEIPGTVPLLHGISDGIDISLPVGAAVKSVADGEVSSVFDLGGDQTVVVKHGKYFTTYSHLESVSVNKGDPVNAGTTLGRAAVDDNGGGGGVITFMVTDDKGNFLDPENWLKSR
jgi:septal ring factor EnvC (AmiA/AmiB activator)